MQRNVLDVIAQPFRRLFVLIVGWAVMTLLLVFELIRQAYYYYENKDDRTWVWVFFVFLGLLVAVGIYNYVNAFLLKTSSILLMLHHP